MLTASLPGGNMFQVLYNLEVGELRLLLPFCAMQIILFIFAISLYLCIFCLVLYALSALALHS